MATIQEKLAAGRSQAMLAAIRAEGREPNNDELLELQKLKIEELRAVLQDETIRAERAEGELDELRARLQRENSLRPSLEVLQRMANGIDPFDIGRFKCAMAALPHEVPKLSASVSSAS